MEKEIRGGIGNIEIRTDEEKENELYAEGYALVFNSWSEDLGGFVETIEPSALEGSDLSDVRALFNHNADKVLARSTAGTLELETDNKGLKFRFKLPNTSYGKDVAENLRNGNINQCSFGFVLDEDGDNFDYDEKRSIYQRTLKKIKSVMDISLVTYPAYSSTSAAPALRSIDRIESELLEQRQIQHEKEKLKLELELL